MNKNITKKYIGEMRNLKNRSMKRRNYIETVEEKRSRFLFKTVRNIKERNEK